MTFGRRKITPLKNVKRVVLVDDYRLTTIMVAVGLAKSQSEARRLIKAGAVKLWRTV